MIVIGLCGQSGAGKTTALEVFRKKGFGVIDCDRISREVTLPGSPCLDALASAFGGEIIAPDGTLKRQALADIVFSDGKRLEELNRITHRFILEEVFSRLDAFCEEGKEVAVVDAPVLFESGLDRHCDTTLAICADTEIRIDRITKRDGIDRDRALARIARQLSEKELVSLSDRVIYNNEGVDAFEKEILEYADATQKSKP